MRSLLILSILAVQLIICSCGGSDDTPPIITPEVELGAFDLIYPENNTLCTEGITLTDNEVSIPLQWSASKNATSYKIEVTNTTTGAKTEKTAATNSLDIELPKGTKFSWKVTALLDDKTQPSNEAWNFYSEGISVSNHTPFPASIVLLDNKDGTIDINWEGSDIDNDILNYKIFLSDTNPTTDLIAETEDTSIKNFEIDYNTIYYLKVVTIDQNGNTSSSKKEFKFDASTISLYIFHDSQNKLAKIDPSTGNLTYIGNNIEYGVNTRGAIFHNQSKEYIGFENAISGPMLVKINTTNGNVLNINIPNSFLTNGSNFRDLVKGQNEEIFIFHSSEKKLAKINLTNGNLTYIGTTIEYGTNTRGAVYNSKSNEYIGFDNVFGAPKLVKINIDTGSTTIVTIPNSFLINGEDFSDLAIDNNNDLYIFHDSEKKLAKINQTTGNLTYIGNNINYGLVSEGAVFDAENNEYIGFENNMTSSELVRININNGNTTTVPIDSSFLTSPIGEDFDDFTINTK